MIGKYVVVLSSGDVGLIMARRLKFEGVNVLGVVEIFPYASGLPRNVVQCLDDYGIPLYLNHTVTFIKGKDRLESVTIAQVDDNLKAIEGTEKEIKCDTLLLSLGLVPENELSKEVGIKLDSITGGPIVNQDFETSLSGVFACGNCLQVYDTVDVLSVDAKVAGKNAAKTALIEKKTASEEISVKAGKNVCYVIPQKINDVGKISLKLRVIKPKKTPILRVSVCNQEIYKKKLPYANPANMIIFNVNVSENLLKSGNSLEVRIDD